MFCFECNSIESVSKDTSCKQRIKMNEILNKFLLVGDKFMPEIHLKQPGLLTVLVVHSQKFHAEKN